MQSVCCGNTADLVEPLYDLMAERVCISHLVATDDTAFPMQAKVKVANACIVGLHRRRQHPYNFFDFTLDRGRDARCASLRLRRRDVGRRLCRLRRGGRRQPDYKRRVLGSSERKFFDTEKAAPEIARSSRTRARALCRRGENVAAKIVWRDVAISRHRWSPSSVCGHLLEGVTAAQASHGRGYQLRSCSVERTNRVPRRLRRFHR